MSTNSLNTLLFYFTIEKAILIMVVSFVFSSKFYSQRQCFLIPLSTEEELTAYSIQYVRGRPSSAICSLEFF